MGLDYGDREDDLPPEEEEPVPEKETDLQCAYRLQKWLKDTKKAMELAKVEYDGCIDRIQRSGDLSDGILELINKPRKFWVVNPAMVKEKYPLIYEGLVDEINNSAKAQIAALDTAMPVGKVKDALLSIGVKIDNKKTGIPEGNLKVVAVQVPKDQWTIVPVGAGSKAKVEEPE